MTEPNAPAHVRLPPMSSPHEAVLRHAAAALQGALGEPLAAGIYLVATPIGNLADVTLRALSVLARADVVFCEDTRHSARLLKHFGIATPTRPMHDHNEDSVSADIVEQARRGQRVAVISDAGTPLVSDPGHRLTRQAIADGVDVHVVPGPSAVLAALSLAGLPTDTFLFAGFLPARSAQRRARLAELEAVPATLVFFESPQRLAESLSDMADVLGDRSAAVARELTKRFESVARGPLRALADDISNAQVRGECVVLVGPGSTPAVSDDDLTRALEVALRSMRLKDAAVAVAETAGVPKARVYALGLALKAATQDDVGSKAEPRLGEADGS